MSRRFEPGAELILELSAKVKGTLELLVRVVHATPEKKGLWIIGCTLDCPLSKQELQMFLGVSLSQTATENSPGGLRTVLPAPQV
jgi:hypothetical protein